MPRKIANSAKTARFMSMKNTEFLQKTRSFYKGVNQCPSEYGRNNNNGRFSQIEEIQN